MQYLEQLILRLEDKGKQINQKCKGSDSFL